MAGKKSTKNTLKESISLNVSAQQFYGYADYYNRVPLFPVLQLTNAGAEAAEGLEVTIEGSDGFLLPFAKQLLGSKGFVEIDILTGWSEIVGDELAEFCLPQKIVFPRGQKTGGTLYLYAASGAFALEITHRERFILEKINTRFGYQAVAKIKIVQNGGLALTRPIKTKTAEPSETTATVLAFIV